MSGLTAPFPYYGGKARWAEQIWEKFGSNPGVYTEPFAGSLAVLLANPNPAPREVVCDTNGHICNFWRAIRSDPEGVAYHADYPTIHQDLTARHKWLVRWAGENRDKLSEDPNFHDPKAAGWWVWGISIWIGGNWCTTTTTTGKGDDEQSLSDRIPHSDPRGGGQGVSAQRITYSSQIPYVNPKSGGKGVCAQRRNWPQQQTDQLTDQIPHIKNRPGGSGVSVQRVNQPTIISGGKENKLPGDQIPDIKDRLGGKGISAQRRHIKTREHIIQWFVALSDRLKNVIVLNRGWKSATTPSVIQDTSTGPGSKIIRCILMDPPYVTIPYQGEGKPRAKVYNSDGSGDPDSAAIESYEWAVRNGAKYRIAYCCHENDFPLPEGWTSLQKDFKGKRNRPTNRSRDMIMFSPSCQTKPQSTLQLL